MLKIKSFVFNPFQENTFVLYNQNKECIVFDPGCYNSAEQSELTEFIETINLNPILMINTHCHIDHILGNHFIAQKYDVPLWIHKEAMPLLHAAPTYGYTYGVTMIPSPDPEKFLTESDRVKLGDENLTILHVPGHSPGSICFYSETDKFLLGGDVLFYESIGRTDLPGGNHNQLITNIREKLFVLPDDTTVYCGHGPETTIGHEKAHNPFVSV